MQILKIIGTIILLAGLCSYAAYIEQGLAKLYQAQQTEAAADLAQAEADRTLAEAFKALAQANQTQTEAEAADDARLERAYLLGLILTTAWGGSLVVILLLVLRHQVKTYQAERSEAAYLLADRQRSALVIPPPYEQPETVHHWQHQNQYTKKGR